MEKYLDVKVGDEFFYSKKIGVNHWNTLYFSRKFFLSCKVIRVTKSQFTTDHGRYRKSDGYCIGDGPSIYKSGDNAQSFSRDELIVPDKGQLTDAVAYDNEMKPLRSCQYTVLDRFRITDIKGLDKAKKAASLVEQLIALMDIKER